MKDLVKIVAAYLVSDVLPTILFTICFTDTDRQYLNDLTEIINSLTQRPDFNSTWKQHLERFGIRVRLAFYSIYITNSPEKLKYELENKYTLLLIDLTLTPNKR